MSDTNISSRTKLHELLDEADVEDLQKIKRDIDGRILKLCKDKGFRDIHVLLADDELHKILHEGKTIIWAEDDFDIHIKRECLE